MKINLTLDNSPRSGYVNINPLAPENHPDFIKADLNQLNLYADDGEVTDLVALDVMDYVPIQQKEPLLENWLKTIALNGTITIGGTEIKNVARAFYLNQIDLNQFAELSYGIQVSKSGLITAERMRQILEHVGFKVLEVRIANFSYYVKAKREG